MRVVSGLAAALVVGALLGGFLLLFNAHHTQVGGNSEHKLFTLSDGSDGTVYARNPGDGSVEWRYNLHVKLTGALVASNDTLYVGANDRHVYALRKSDGTLRWRSPAASVNVTAPTFVDKTAIYVSSPTTIFALSIKDGHLLWSRQTLPCNICVAELVAIDGGTLYAYLDGLYALRASDGSILWHHPELSFSSRSLGVMDGNVFVPDEPAGTIHELRASDGQRLKTFTLFQNDKGKLLAMFAENGVLYIYNGGDLYAMRVSDEATLWRQDFGDGLIGMPAHGDGAIYFGQNLLVIDPNGSSSGNSVEYKSSGIIAFTISKGWEWWSWWNRSHTSLIEVTPPIEFEGVVYFSSQHSLYALNARNGTLLWQVSEGPHLSSLLVG